MDQALFGLALVLAAALLAACAGSGGAVSEKEDLLASAGFAPKKADTAARMASMKALPLIDS